MMNKRIDNLKELIRLGTVLTVSMPNIVLNSTTHVHEQARRALTALINDDSVKVSVREYDEDAVVTVGLDGRSDIDRPIVSDLMEWDKLNTSLKNSNRRLAEIKEEYSTTSEQLLKDARQVLEETGEDIIKARYGGNNDKTRKKYVQDSLMNLTNEKKELEFCVSEYNRRISYLKELIRTKRLLMEVEK